MVLFGWASALFLIAPEAVAVGYSLDQPAWVSGLLLASVPAGSALGALLLGRLPLPRQTELLLPLAALSCLPLFATSVGPPPGVAVLMWFVAGIFQAYVITVVASITYLTAPGHRGRVMGVAASGFNAATALSFLIVGWLAEVLDPARAVSLAGAAAWSWWRSPTPSGPPASSPDGSPHRRRRRRRASRIGGTTVPSRASRARTTCRLRRIPVMPMAQMRYCTDRATRKPSREYDVPLPVRSRTMPMSRIVTRADTKPPTLTMPEAVP